MKKLFLVYYSDPWAFYGCEGSCGVEDKQIQAVYTSEEKAREAVRSKSERYPVYKVGDFTIEEVDVDPKLI